MNVYNNLFAFIKSNNDADREEDYFEPLKEKATAETYFKEENREDKDNLSDNSRSKKCQRSRRTDKIGIKKFLCYLCKYTCCRKRVIKRHMESHPNNKLDNDKDLFGIIRCTLCVKGIDHEDCIQKPVKRNVSLQCNDGNSSFVRSVQVCLELFFFIFLTQIYSVGCIRSFVWFKFV